VERIVEHEWATTNDQLKLPPSLFSSFSLLFPLCPALPYFTSLTSLTTPYFTLPYIILPLPYHCPSLPHSLPVRGIQLLTSTICTYDKLRFAHLLFAQYPFPYPALKGLAKRVKKKPSKCFFLLHSKLVY